MKLTYNNEIGKYFAGDKEIESGYTLRITDKVSKQTFNGKVGYSNSYDTHYFLLLMTCGGGELGQVELKYYDDVEIV